MLWKNYPDAVVGLRRANDYTALRFFQLHISASFRNCGAGYQQNGKLVKHLPY